MEKILYEQPDVKQLYLLVRPGKRGAPAAERLRDQASLGHAHTTLLLACSVLHCYAALELLCCIECNRYAGSGPELSLRGPLLTRRCSCQTAGLDTPLQVYSSQAFERLRVKYGAGYSDFMSSKLT